LLRHLQNAAGGYFFAASCIVPLGRNFRGNDVTDALLSWTRLFYNRITAVMLWANTTDELMNHTRICQQNQSTC